MNKAHQSLEFPEFPKAGKCGVVRRTQQGGRFALLSLIHTLQINFGNWIQKQMSLELNHSDHFMFMRLFLYLNLKFEPRWKEV